MTEHRRRKRLLSREERALWTTVTQKVAPLRGKTDLESDAPDPPQVDADAPPPLAPTVPKRAQPAPRIARAAPALAPLEKRLRQRLGRGSHHPDARIDLHGMTQDRAHSALLSFLRGAQRNGARVILVITGKGARGEHGERGVLRRAVPQWLALPEFRALVVGYETAHITHGGEGALYVRVRKKKEDSISPSR